MTFSYLTMAELIEAAQREHTTISELVLKEQAEQLEQSCEEVYDRMRDQLQVMLEAIEAGCDPDIRSTSGLTGGDAAKVHARYEAGQSLTGPVIGGALWRAMAVSELNASMGRIVAAPTAGSCGILPSALATMQASYHCDERQLVMAMFTAASVGMVIGNVATLAGASGGCQAECGSAAAMAAAAIVELAGGTPDMAGHAIAIAIKNILGLVCDPVAGLVEIPCIKRNAAGISIAFMAAELALAGVPSYIPADETILALKQIGDALPAALRETADGGLATTPTGQRLREQVFGKQTDPSNDGCVGCATCQTPCR